MCVYISLYRITVTAGYVTVLLSKQTQLTAVLHNLRWKLLHYFLEVYKLPFFTYYVVSDKQNVCIADIQVSTGTW